MIIQLHDDMMKAAHQTLDRMVYFMDKFSSWTLYTSSLVVIICEQEYRCDGQRKFTFAPVHLFSNMMSGAYQVAFTYSSTCAGHLTTIFYHHSIRQMEQHVQFSGELMTRYDLFDQRNLSRKAAHTYFQKGGFRITFSECALHFITFCVRCLHINSIVQIPLYIYLHQ